MTGRRNKPYSLAHGGTILEMSPREHRVLVYLVAGVRVEDMCRALRIHRSTVNTYTDRFLRMAGAHNRTQLAAWAILTGLVSAADVWELWGRFAPELGVWRAERETMCGTGD